MAKQPSVKQVDPDLVPQPRIGNSSLRTSMSAGIGGRISGAGILPGGPMAGRGTTSAAMPTPARMKAGKGISNGVKPGKQRVR